MYLIEHLKRPVSDADLQSLALLLMDAVDSGGVVSFLAPMAIEYAREWWRSTLAAPNPRAIFLVARDEKGIVGTVQLQPAWAPNQPHRADVVKLMVHRRGRGAGLGRQLMELIEQNAHAAGFTLLTLDAKRGGAADHLYRKLGWTLVGTIPKFAFDTDGKTPHDNVIYYKELA